MASKKRKKVAKKARKSAKAPKSRKTTPKRRSKTKKARKLTKVELLTRQVTSLQKRLRKYERQRFVGPIAPGQKRRKPSKTEIETHRNELKLFFERVKQNLEVGEIASKYRSHENADGSIDAELRVPLEDSGDVKGHLVDIEDAGNWNGLSEYWVSMGLNASSETETGSPTIDRRPNLTWTHSVRGNRSGAAFFTIGNTVVDKLEEWGADFSMIVIRVRWSPTAEQPQRPDRRRRNARPSTSVLASPKRKRKASKKPVKFEIEGWDEPEDD